MQIDQAYTRLNIIRDYIPVGNSNRPGITLSPALITIHNTDNDQPGANAAAHAKYQKGPDARAREVSWHFTVDDGPVYQSLPTNEVGWHAGPAANSSSIGIEICMNPELNVQAAYDNAALLVALMAYQFQIPVPKGIVQHNHWTGKNCPRILRAKAGAWDAFLIQVTDYARDLQDVSAPDLSPADDHHEHGGGAPSTMGVLGGAQVVIASGGLRVRGGPGVEFDIISTLPLGTKVHVLSRLGDWGQVDATGDGSADGFVHVSFLRPVPA